jgi:hypothetical protein
VTQRDPAKQLAKELADLRKEVRSGSRGSQMRFRALEGGGIPIFSEDGTPRGTIGILPDGTTGYETINDPTPPMPSAPILEPANAGLKIIWDGTFWADAPRPGDLRCVEVHASPYSVYTPDASTLRATFITAGEIFLNLPPDPYTVVFVSRTTGNSRSEPSVSATETPLPEVTLRDLELIDAAAKDAADKAFQAEQTAADAQTAASTAADEAEAARQRADAAEAAATAASGSATTSAADVAAARAAATAAQADADAAILRAQEAADAAEAAEAQAATATGTVLAAQTAADEANTAAQAALAQAQAAGTNVTAAQAAADAAQDAADLAAQQASAAGTAAATADAAAAQAAADAAQALADAAAAASSASASAGSASTATGRALAAEQAADKAADDAYAALQQATASGTSASAAQTAATNAQTAATTARQQAEAAGTAAAAADADAAEAAADAAQAAADALKAKEDAAAARQAATDSATSAGQAVTVAQQAASGKNTIFYSLEVAPATGNEKRVAGDTWFHRDAVGRILGQWEWVVPATGTASWVSRTLSSQVIAFLDVGKLTTGQIAAGQRIIAGPEDATHAEMSDTGFRVFVEDPADGIPNEVVRLGVPRDGDNGGDVLGVADSDGRLVASVSETGVGSFTGLNIDGDPIIQGVPLSEQMSEALAGRVLGFYRGNFSKDITPIENEIGIVEVNAFLEAGRSYSIRAHFGWFQNIPNQEATFRIRSTRTATDGGDTAPAPTITSTQEERWWRTHPGASRTYTEDLELLYNCTRTGRHRFLLTAQNNKTAPFLGNNAECSGRVHIIPIANTPTLARVDFPWAYDGADQYDGFATVNSTVAGTTVQGVGVANMTADGMDVVLTRTNTSGTTVFWNASGIARNNGRLTVDATILTTMAVVDAGPTPPVSGQPTAGGGVIGTNPVTPGGSTAPPAPTQPTSPSTTKQQYYRELGPVGKVSWRGNNTVRTDLGPWDVVQGRDPSGYNGIGKGAYWFDLPSITGTVDRVDVYLYSAHWYYNSGGVAVLNINDQRGADPNMFKMRGDWLVGGYPKPGGKWVTVPGDWFGFFKGANNDLFNGRATTITIGPTNDDLVHYGRFTDCRLRIWYTQ